MHNSLVSPRRANEVGCEAKVVILKSSFLLMARNIRSVQARQGALLVTIEMTSMAFYTTRGTPRAQILSMTLWVISALVEPCSSRRRVRSEHVGRRDARSMAAVGSSTNWTRSLSSTAATLAGQLCHQIAVFSGRSLSG